MLTPLNELFEVTYGNKLDLNKLQASRLEDGGVNFVGRSSQNLGVSGVVTIIDGLEPYAEGLITVALGGSKLLSSFVQDAPFYTAQNVAVLRPLEEMTFQQKLYVCLAIRRNRFRYSAFGREANRTLRTLEIPALKAIPSWIEKFDPQDISKWSLPIKYYSDCFPLDTSKWQSFLYSDLFDIRKGRRLTKANMTMGATPFVGASDRNNGITRHIGQDPIHEGGTISIPYNGSVGEAFYQPMPFWASDDVNVLYPKEFELDPLLGLFLCTIIRQERYRYSYGRKWHLERMEKSSLRLPVSSTGKPNWRFIRNFMGSLAYSSRV